LGKIFPDAIAKIDQGWTGEAPIRLTFMDEARLGTITEKRHFTIWSLIASMRLRIILKQNYGTWQDRFNGRAE
jgi:hypothetical protein